MKIAKHPCSGIGLRFVYMPSGFFTVVLQLDAWQVW